MQGVIKAGVRRIGSQLFTHARGALACFERDVVHVLAYGAVGEFRGTPLETQAVTGARLRKHIDLLRSLRCNFVAPSQFAAFLSGKTSLPPRSILLTFDGGYAPFRTDALPVLRQHAIPALLFVATRKLGEWNDWDGDKGYPRIHLLSIQDLRDLTAHGVTVGTHGRSHARLADLPEAKRSTELVGASTDLARLGFEGPHFFAYPWGRANPELEKAVAEAKFLAAFTTDLGVVRRGSSHTRLPRIAMHRSEHRRTFIKRIISAGGVRV